LWYDDRAMAWSLRRIGKLIELKAFYLILKNAAMAWLKYFEDI